MLVMEKIQNIVSIQLLQWEDLPSFSVSYTVILKWISYIDSWSDKEVTVGSAISQSQRWQNSEMAIFTVFWHFIDMKLIQKIKQIK